MKGILAILKAIYSFIAGVGKLTVGLFSLLLILFVMLAAQGMRTPGVQVENGVVLVFEPNGIVVEQPRAPDPMEYLFEDYSAGPPEVSIHDILFALEAARTDDRVVAMAFSGDSLWGAAPSHMHDIADAIRAFKAAGKKVYAISTSYGQGDYMLAAEADKVFLNPAGSVLLSGYGSYPTYFRSMLEKIDASVNVFRVGTYKSAVEPFLRDDMSPEARAANEAFLSDLWREYAARVSQARGLEGDALDALVENTPERLRTAQGNFADFALQEKLVDQLTHRRDWRLALKEEYGADGADYSFRQIHWEAYLAAVRKPEPAAKRIAVITAQGEIVMGYGSDGVAAAETIVGYIRDARKSPDVAAIVLRVDSPGGSAFASELIRQELVAAQNEGKPVIASFGPTAASGGYWIAATADEIWAAPTTITGSIGIFGVMATFENTLAKAGVYSDGVGTSSLASGASLTRPLSEPIKDIIQQSIENGYDEFITLVAGGRGMTTADVDAIAQGRVWTGNQALERGLVDHLGSFEDAIKAAAAAAGLERYRVDFYREGVDQFDQFLISLFQSRVGAWMIDRQTRRLDLPPTAIRRELAQLQATAERLMRFNDPNGQYVLCLTCDVR